MIVGTTLSGHLLKAQSCSLAPIFNGTTTINGIEITTSYLGNIEPFNGAFRFGYNREAWSLTLAFNHPVNNLVFYYAPNLLPAFSTNAHFNTNGGPVSIIATYGYSNWIINSNTVTKPYNITGGNGNFKITSPNDFTTITINGDAFPSNLQENYAAIALCSSSEVLALNDVNSKIKNNIVDIYPNPVKNMMIISSKETLKYFKLFDESGKRILTSPLKGNEYKVNLSMVPKWQLYSFNRDS
ncbi:hypothetical protein D1631_05800 [Chryseobacterium nematophagum]|uniref:T9SS C-terminal target domain-containing protein n=2 Tax=Chryseobacterium nematophagum TaxID=2305228 RepID=A0A3M7TGY1_9FLAO|nr:hypothetical protein D1631_05800 [Chryseobacterium nematophagum]